MNRFAKLLYDKILRRSSTLGLSVVVAAFFFERAFDVVTDGIWEGLNRGKLWDDIKENYTVKGGGDDDDDGGNGGGMSEAVESGGTASNEGGEETGEGDDNSGDQDGTEDDKVVVENGNTEEVSNRKKLGGKSLLRYL